jgi:hypothetical protein
VPYRANDTNSIANFLVTERPESFTHNLEQDLDPAITGVSSHNRQWPAHRNRCVTLYVREAARQGSRRAFRRMQPDNNLLTRIFVHIDDDRIFYENCAAICLRATRHLR